MWCSLAVGVAVAQAVTAAAGSDGYVHPGIMVSRAQLDAMRVR